MDEALLDEVRNSNRFHAWRLFLHGYRAVLDALEAELIRSQGLPLTWYDVLAQLDLAADHRLRMHELAEQVLISKSGLTRLVDRMEGIGLVERTTCPSDRRGSFAVLTEEGRRAFEAAFPVHVDGVRRYFANNLTDTEARTLVRALSKIAGRERSERATLGKLSQRPARDTVRQGA
jgi:DNA-binding MarR family transcriptional regulator